MSRIPAKLPPRSEHLTCGRSRQLSLAHTFESSHAFGARLIIVTVKLTSTGFLLGCTIIHTSSRGGSCSGWIRRSHEGSFARERKRRVSFSLCRLITMERDSIQVMPITTCSQHSLQSTGGSSHKQNANQTGLVAATSTVCELKWKACFSSPICGVFAP